jgi:hypothetical protein
MSAAVVEADAVPASDKDTPAIPASGAAFFQSLRRDILSRLFSEVRTQRWAPNVSSSILDAYICFEVFTRTGGIRLYISSCILQRSFYACRTFSRTSVLIGTLHKYFRLFRLLLRAVRALMNWTNSNAAELKFDEVKLLRPRLPTV